jgi:glutamine phosphoribosylpyrophosphate amidotransferase
MCAVIGVIIQNPTPRDLETVRNVFFESKIRGMHATGMSYLPHWSDKVETVRMEGSSEKFIAHHLHHLDYLVNEDGNLYLIGHTRYSTSDLEFNQPIANSSLSVVHNGVTSQELPEKWEELYGYKCETKNDTELLLHTIQEDVSPLRRWKDASLSVCVLQRSETSKALKVFRNGKRPLYLTNLPNGSIITSTVDIARRAGLTAEIEEIPFNTYVTFDEYLTMSVERVDIDGAIDYQNEFH